MHAVKNAPSRVMLSDSEASQATALVACRPWMLSAAKHDITTTGFNSMDMANENGLRLTTEGHEGLPV